MSAEVEADGVMNGNGAADAAAAAAVVATPVTPPTFPPPGVDPLPPFPIVDVEPDPLLAEQIEEQKQHPNEINQLRTLLAEFNEQHKDQTLVRDFLTSDRTVWRFLKARKYDLNASAQMFRDAVTYRKEKQLDTILQRPITKGLEYKVVSRHGWHGFDKYGRPIFIKNTGLQHFPTLYATGTLEQRCHYNLFVNEFLRQVLCPAATARTGNKVVIDQVVTIVNLQNFGWHCIKKFNYDWVREIANANGLLYPETAGICFIINAPRVFSMVWSIVRRWVDERTQSKIQILSGDGVKEMKAVLGEECVRNLPKEIGGECVCMDAKDVPPHGAPCMLGHPISKHFIELIRKRNDEAGISNTYTPPTEVEDQEEARDMTEKESKEKENDEQ